MGHIEHVIELVSCQVCDDHLGKHLLQDATPTEETNYDYTEKHARRGREMLGIEDEAVAGLKKIAKEKGRRRHRDIHVQRLWQMWFPAGG